MKLLVLAALVAVAASAPHELAQNNEEQPQHTSIHQDLSNSRALPADLKPPGRDKTLNVHTNNLENLSRIKRGSAGTGFAQGIASVLEQFKPPEQIPNDGKYTAPGYVHLPPDQYKAYQDKVNELHKQGKL